MIGRYRASFSPRNGENACIPRHHLMKRRRAVPHPLNDLSLLLPPRPAAAPRTTNVHGFSASERGEPTEYVPQPRAARHPCPASELGSCQHGVTVMSIIPKCSANKECVCARVCCKVTYGVNAQASSRQIKYLVADTSAIYGARCRVKQRGPNPDMQRRPSLTRSSRH